MSGNEKNRISEQEKAAYLAIYLQHCSTALTVNSLFVGFIFTALTLILMGSMDLSSLLPQVTLVVLTVSFFAGVLQLGIIQMRENIMAVKAVYPRLQMADTPGWRARFPLMWLYLTLMFVSINLMFFVRGLTYSGIASLVVSGLTMGAYWFITSRAFR